MSGMRQIILECARDIYLEQGLEGLSMRKVAKMADITPMAIYRHFDNKDELLEQLLAWGFRSFGEYLRQALRGENALERMKLTTQAYLSFALEQSKYFEVIFLATDQIKTLKVKEVIRCEAQATFTFLVDRVRECISEGIFRDEPVKLIAITILAEVNGLVSLHLTHTFDWTAEEFQSAFKSSLEKVISGFLA